MIKSRNGHMPQYNVQSSVCNKHKLIATTWVSDQANDKQHLQPMVERTAQDLGVEVKQVNADSDYYTIGAIEELSAAGKEVYVAVSEAGQKKVVDEKGQPVEFVYDAQQDLYRCSQGRELPLLSRGVIKHGRKMNRYRSKDCSGCALRKACTTSKIGRSIYRYDNAQWLEAYKRKMKGPLGKAMLKQRRCTVEHPFGTIRSVLMGHIPLLLRGRAKVQTEIDLYHLGYNFKRVCNIAGNEVLHYQIQQYDWQNAARAIQTADEQRKTAQKQKKAG